MSNIENNFVPYQIALDMKSIGFDEPCLGVYYESKTFYIYTKSKGVKNSDKTSQSWVFTAPTFSQAFRWFREKYNIDAWVQPFTSKKSNGDLYLPDGTYSYFIFKYGVWVRDGVDFLEPEKAELECIKKLIQIVKTQL